MARPPCGQQLQAAGSIRSCEACAWVGPGQEFLCRSSAPGSVLEWREAKRQGVAARSSSLLLWLRSTCLPSDSAHSRTCQASGTATRERSELSGQPLTGRRALSRLHDWLTHGRNRDEQKGRRGVERTSRLQGHTALQAEICAVGAMDVATSANSRKRLGL